MQVPIRVLFDPGFSEGRHEDGTQAVRNQPPSGRAMIDVATRILLHDKLRFVITVSGVAFAVTLVLVQVGLFLGLLDNASITIQKCNADLWVTSRNTANVDYGQPFPAGYVNRVRSVPGVERADNLIVWFTRLTLPSGATELVIVYALEDFTRWNLPWALAEGDLRDLRRGHYVILDESARKRYGAFAVGDHLAGLRPCLVRLMTMKYDPIVSSRRYGADGPPYTFSSPVRSVAFQTFRPLDIPVRSAPHKNRTMNRLDCRPSSL